jgi:hypothetical protein
VIRLEEEEQDVGEADERVDGPAAGAADGRRQRVEGTVGERVAVEDQQRCV